jgi:hypothetical protein
MEQITGNYAQYYYSIVEKLDSGTTGSRRAASS